MKDHIVGRLTTDKVADMELDMVPLVRERKWMDDVMRCHRRQKPEHFILDWFKSVLLFAIQHAELRSQALRQCWSTRQWDIVVCPTDPMETSLHRINIQQFTSKFFSTPLLPPEIQDEIFSKLPFISRNADEKSQVLRVTMKPNVICVQYRSTSNAGHLKLLLEIR